MSRGRGHSIMISEGNLTRGGGMTNSLIGKKIVVPFAYVMLYRDRLKGLQILLSRTQAGPGRSVKEEQE